MKKFLFTLLIMLASANVFSQKEHFGLMLGAHYKVGEIGKNFKSLYGDYFVDHDAVEIKVKSSGETKWIIDPTERDFIGFGGIYNKGQIK